MVVMHLCIQPLVLRYLFFVAFSGSLDIKHDDIRLFPIFNTLVSNETDNNMMAEFQTTQYILPKKSCFFMVDYFAFAYY